MIGLTQHAVARYRERVRPALDADQVRRELLALLELAGDPGPPPEWVHAAADPCHAYLELADGVALGLKANGRTRWDAVTVFVRGGEAESYRRHRARKRKQEKQRQRLRREAEKRSREGHRKRARARREEEE